MKIVICFFPVALLILSCAKNEDLRVQELPNTAVELLDMEAALVGMPTESNYNRSLPNYLGVLGMNVQQAEDRKAGLGRVLFYDKNLSRDRSVSCASCHKQSRAFSDDVAFSKGIEGNLTHRNTQPLANVASFSAHYSSINGKTPMLFWDERSADVASQSRQTFGNPLEMGLEMDQVVDRVMEQKYYPYLWRRVYGHFEPTEAEILECLQEFVGAMGSHTSSLDRSLDQALELFENPTVTQSDTIITAFYYGGHDTIINTIVTGLPGMNASQNRGRDIFVANCTKCHSPVRPFQQVFAACNGLDLAYSDKGLAELTGLPADEGVFKSPSLRNIALTAPYMHDGRFNTLEAVVDFYSEGVKRHPNLHPLMLHEGSPHLNLSPGQKQDLISFLHTFSDEQITYDFRFSNPFKR